MKKPIYYLVASMILLLVVWRGCDARRFQTTTPVEDATPNLSPTVPPPTVSPLHALQLPLTPGTPPPPFTARIGGSVTDLQHQPLADLRVVLYHLAHDVSGVTDWQEVAATKTDTAGVYTFTGLPPSTFRIGFVDDSQPLRFPAAYYTNTTNVDLATDIRVAVGAVITAINAQLAGPGRITGRVTDQQASPLAAIEVTVYGDPPAPVLVGTVTTDSAGVYTFTGLTTGNYYITFFDPFRPPRYNFVTYGNSGSIEDAQRIAVGAGETITGIDVQLPATGNISGVVTDQQGQPLANIIVTVSYPGAFEANAYIDAGVSTTDAAGAYTVSGLPVGSFHIGFVDANQPPRYLETYYPGVATAEAATLISVTEAARISGINVQLASSERNTR